jgi:hypothetical protein
MTTNEILNAIMLSETLHFNEFLTRARTSLNARKYEESLQSLEEMPSKKNSLFMHVPLADLPVLLILARYYCHITYLLLAVANIDERMV